MEFQNTSKGEHYNLRWNNYTTNLIQVFSEHQHHETLVDVTLTCEGQFVKAHKLILSACSGFFQEMFKMHSGIQHPFIVLNGVKFNHLTHILDFIYHGEIKILDADLEGVLSLGEYFQVKGLSSVKLKQQVPPQNEPKNTPLKYASTDPVYSAANSLQDTTVSHHKQNIKSPSNNMPKNSSNKSNRVSKIGQNVSNRTELEDVGNAQSRLGFSNNKDRMETSRKRLRTPEVPPASNNKEPVESPATGNSVDNEKIPRPANAFMIFATEWRRKLAVEHPDENNKGISVRLGNMWKSLSTETKDAYYLAARKEQRAHELKYPGYSYNPQEARRKKAARRKTIDSVPQMDSQFESDEDDLQIIEINEDPIDISDTPDNKEGFF